VLPKSASVPAIRLESGRLLSTMDTKQAKDFLVEQAAEQAAIEGVPLADLEKRMMYFTESDPASCPDPVALNDEFEAQFETPEYEAKMVKLFEHARRRLRKDDPGRSRSWDEAVSELTKGDHYILILLGLLGSPVALERPKHDFLKLVLTAVLVVAGFVLASFVAEKFNIDSRYVLWLFVALLVVAWTGFSRHARLLLSGYLARRKQR
jgi:hypothetical protein